jgi:hypothetical protein
MNALTRSERALGKLIGTPMWGSARAVDMEMFAFGRQIEATDFRGRMTERAELALHVQCPWHLVQRGSLITGSGDLFAPASGDRDHDFDWQPVGSNRRDVILEAFFRESGLLVERIGILSAGLFVVHLSGGTELRIFPDRSSNGEEHWRFLASADEPHVVFRTEGFSVEG